MEFAESRSRTDVRRKFEGREADLSVRAQTKNELVANLKAARVHGIELRATVPARTDEVIE
jgi:hypothetical protein